MSLISSLSWHTCAPHLTDGYGLVIALTANEYARGGPNFLEIEGRKEAHSARIPRRRLRASRGRGDPDGLEAFGVTGGQLALGTSNAPPDYTSPVFCTRQRHSGTAAREQFADRHKTVARRPTVAGLASK